MSESYAPEQASEFGLLPEEQKSIGDLKDAEDYKTGVNWFKSSLK